MDFLLKGLVIGASIAAPVGPVGLLFIQRTMLQGRFHGFVSGLGAATADSTPGVGWSYLSPLLLTIANPMTILSFVAVFAALGVENSSHDYAGAILATLGVFLGSALWWLMLSSFAGWLRDKLNRTALLWIGRSSAVVIMGFGILGVVSSGVIA